MYWKIFTDVKVKFCLHYSRFGIRSILILILVCIIICVGFKKNPVVLNTVKGIKGKRRTSDPCSEGMWWPCYAVVWIHLCLGRVTAGQYTAVGRDNLFPKMKHSYLVESGLMSIQMMWITRCGLDSHLNPTQQNICILKSPSPGERICVAWLLFISPVEF